MPFLFDVTSHVGVGSDPNYGTFLPAQNSPNGGGIRPITYDGSSMLFNQQMNPIRYNNQQQQPYPSNGNSGWQGGNGNNNPYASYNRYPPGSAGWYATGGNYQYNMARPLSMQSSTLLLSILILLTCY